MRDSSSKLSEDDETRTGQSPFGPTRPGKTQLKPAEPASPSPSGTQKLATHGPGIKRGTPESRKQPHFRRPLPPAPLERYDIVHPAVPDALEGFTILHITDLHIRRHRPRPPAIKALLESLIQTESDLVVLTGDFMDRPGDEKTALASLRLVVDACRARLGIVGVVGNHDSGPLRERLVDITGVRWLTKASPIWDALPDLRLIGSQEPEDLLASVLASPPPPPGALHIALIHYPSEVYTAADLGIPLALAGHTHAGQFRITPRLAPHTSSDLPADLATGILRLRQTLCAVSRGLGQAVIEARFNCPPQAPLYVLRRGELPAIEPADFHRLTMHTPW